MLKKDFVNDFTNLIKSIKYELLEECLNDERGHKWDLFREKLTDRFGRDFTDKYDDFAFDKRDIELEKLMEKIASISTDYSLNMSTYLKEFAPSQGIEDDQVIEFLEDVLIDKEQVT